MKISKRLLKITAVSISCLIVLLVAGYLLLRMIRSWGIITETREKIENLSGFNFEIIETNSDRLAKEDWITIFASKVGEDKKTLLFEYVPHSYDDPVPTIRISDSHNILISIPAISSTGSNISNGSMALLIMKSAIYMTEVLKRRNEIWERFGPRDR